METSSLNQAHHYERKADSFLKHQKFPEAIECYQKTVELLADAMKLSTADKALESLQLQRDSHIRKQAVIRYKQELCRKGSTSSRPADKIGFSTIDGEPSSSSSSPSPFPTAHIQEAIYKSIEENDSLLRGLITPQPLPDAITQSAIKTPKDDKTVIEELQINNNELRQLVDKLITELDKYVQENARLKAEVQKLKSKLNSHPGSSERHKLNVINDTDSPFILLPGGDLSPVGSRPLPNLPPLEMPSFDFNSIRPSTDT